MQTVKFIFSIALGMGIVLIVLGLIFGLAFLMANYTIPTIIGFFAVMVIGIGYLIGRIIYQNNFE